MEKGITSLHPLTQGKKLYILVFRAREKKITTDDVAMGLGVAPEYLPTLYKKKTLSMKIIHSASEFFDVSKRVFDPDETLNEVLRRLDDVERHRMQSLEKTRELSEQIVLLQAELIKLRRKRKQAEGDDAPNHN